MLDNMFFIRVSLLFELHLHNSGFISKNLNQVKLNAKEWL